VTPEGQTPFNLLANTPNNGLNVTGTGPGAKTEQVNVPQDRVNRILRESQVGRAVTEENRAQIAQDGAQQIGAVTDAAIDAATNGQAGGGTQQPGTDGNQPYRDQDPTGDKGGGGPKAGGGACQTPGNLVKNCSFEITGSIPDWNVTGA